MSWRDRYPFPMKREDESEEDYEQRLEEYYQAESDAAEEYIERKQLENLK